MKVTQEKLPASQIGLEIEVPPEMSKKTYERVLQNFTRSVNIPGFRKGKVPRQVLIQRFGVQQIKAAVVEELIEDGIQQAIKQENIEALGNFQLRSSFEDLVKDFEPGQALIFSAAVDVQPQATLSQYKGLSVQAEEIKPDPERVNQVLEQYREQMATLVPVEGRPAQMGDTAVVDFKGVLPGEDPDAEPEEVPGGQAEDFQVELAEGRFIEGFVDGIVGMQPGETKEIQATFPESYPQETLAGRPAVFTVTLKELKEKELPELDDDFAQEVSEHETLAELRETLEKRFLEEAEGQTRSNKEQAILDALIQHLEVDIPETLMERELNYMLNQTAMQLQNQGIDVKQLFNEETIANLKERSRPDATGRIQRTLALGEVAKQESLQVEAEELSAKVNEVLQELSDNGMDKDIDRERLQSLVSEDLLKEKILSWLLDNNTVELVPEGTLSQAEPEATLDDEQPETVSETAEASQADSGQEVTAKTIDVEASPVEDDTTAKTKPAKRKTAKSKSKPANE